jgi:hypothetical protein
MLFLPFAENELRRKRFRFKASCYNKKLVIYQQKIERKMNKNGRKNDL